MDREALTKDRSVARCIAEGYRLFTGQQLTTLRRTWKPLVASSLGWSLSITTALCGQWIGTALALLLALAALLYQDDFSAEFRSSDRGRQTRSSGAHD